MQKRRSRENWAGVPLKDLETIEKYIATTTTSTGLKVTTALNERVYPKGEKVSEIEFKQLKCEHAPDLPEWNYTVHPKTMAFKM
ncbi:hypothetical protein HY464_02785 [Candidatus Peregrinibacteria bacterium]|nr:hypothetical protein [Candidatus Peregrinibacteria bacterium]